MYVTYNNRWIINPIDPAGTNILKKSFKSPQKGLRATAYKSVVY